MPPWGGRRAKGLDCDFLQKPVHLVLKFEKWVKFIYFDDFLRSIASVRFHVYSNFTLCISRAETDFKANGENLGLGLGLAHHSKTRRATGWASSLFCKKPRLSLAWLSCPLLRLGLTHMHGRARSRSSPILWNKVVDEYSLCFIIHELKNMTKIMEQQHFEKRRWYSQKGSYSTYIVCMVHAVRSMGARSTSWATCNGWHHVIGGNRGARRGGAAAANYDRLMRSCVDGF
jgi:hypothetical protein